MRASGHVVTCQHGIQTQAGIKVFGELGTKLAQLWQRKVSQFTTLFQTITDCIANMLMRFSEGNSLVNQIGRSRQGIHESSLGRALHALVVKLNLAHETDCRLETLHCSL